MPTHSLLQHSLAHYILHQKPTPTLTFLFLFYLSLSLSLPQVTSKTSVTQGQNRQALGRQDPLERQVVQASNMATSEDWPIGIKYIYTLYNIYISVPKHLG